jgi:putative Mg2+ transporter-C (MgtC) family protein
MFLSIPVNNYVDPIAKLLGTWLADINVWSIIVRLVLAVILSGIIGLERAVKRRAAGFRTYILVCVSSAIIMMTNQFIFESYGQGDIARLGAQAVSGIGFLCAGTIIITSRNRIQGLTTAAGLWASTCMGLAIGIGFYTMAIIGCIVIVLSLSLLVYIETNIREHLSSFEIQVELVSSEKLQDFLKELRDHSFHVIAISKNIAYSGSNLTGYTMTLIKDLTKKDHHKKFHKDAIQWIQSIEYVNYVEEL